MAVVGGHALPTQKIHQAPMMFGRNVDEAATALSACCMGQLENAVNLALGFKLTLDLHPVSDQ